MDLPWKYGVAESILIEWSFGVSWTEDLLILDVDNAFALFLIDRLSTVELELVLDACNWFELSKNVTFGFWNERSEWSD